MENKVIIKGPSFYNLKQGRQLAATREKRPMMTGDNDSDNEFRIIKLYHGIRILLHGTNKFSSVVLLKQY